mmetsp:Transcript_11519/g.31069  ORF Transcript_11519/g.31069 Transcript_11519/m.31069 type:complete len:556 (-) Transcript_11519:1511-3178(-)
MDLPRASVVVLALMLSCAAIVSGAPIADVSRQSSEYCPGGVEPARLPSYVDTSYSSENATIECGLFQDIDWVRVNISAAMRGTVFRGGSMTRIQFASQMMYSEFQACDLDEFRAILADFSRTRFSNLTLKSSAFAAVHLKNAALKNVDVIQSRFGPCNMSAVEFGKNVRVMSTQFEGVIFDFGIFTSTTFDETVFSDTNANEANLIDVTISNSRMSTSSFRMSKFQNLKLVNSSITDCEFHRADFSSAKFSGVTTQRGKFWGTNLGGSVWDSGCAVKNSDFHNANLSNADLRGVVIDEASSFRNALCVGMQVDGGCEKFCRFRECLCEAPTPSPTASPAPYASSSPTPLPTFEPDPACFPGDATVELDSGDRIAMRDLFLGARVRVRAQGSGSTREDEFEPVMLFIHKEPDQFGVFDRIVLETGSQLVASSSHYIFAPRSSLIPMGQVQVGDYIILDDGELGRVASIHRNVLKRGIYNPHTASGSLFVNNVHASCYTTAVYPFVAHLLLAPYRVLARLSPMRALAQLFENALEHGLSKSIAGLSACLWRITGVVS